MQTRTLTAAAVGALVGAVSSIAVLALSAARIISGGVTTDAGGEAILQIGQGSAYTLIVVASAVVGGLIGMLGYAVGKEAAPDSPRFRAGPLATVSVASGAVIGFAASRVAFGIAADIEGGVITISVFRVIIAALATGAVTGLVIAATIERLSRPEALGFGGEAWPSSPVAFIKDAMTAIGIPTAAIVIGAIVAGSLGQVLLELPTEAALLLFSGVAALILAGATLIAATGPKPEPADEPSEQVEEPAAS